MTQQFSLEQLLSQAGKRMRSDLKERLVPHPGELGTEREEIVRDFLRSYLPRKFEVSTGFAFDAAGSISQQLDIIIADATTCPRFETTGKKHFFPCESIVAVGQVKSKITSANEFRRALENLQSVKALDRSANGKARDHLTNEPIDQRCNHLHQIFTFLFVTGKMLSEEAVFLEMLEYMKDTESHLWPNVIVAIDRYMMTYCCDGGICSNPMPARGIAFQGNSTEHDVLMKFYLQLGRAIEVTRICNMPYWEYLHSAKSFDAEIWYSCISDPPPYLGSL